MGLDQRIVFAAQHAPTWPHLVERVVARGVKCSLRMIDGELAFPDELPPDTWRELRLGTPHGMLTLRREADGINLVVWGNADAALLADRDAIAGALVEMTQGNLST